MRLGDAFTSAAHKRQYVRQLFSTIADRYGLITVVLSFGRDRTWKRRVVREARMWHGARVLDLACGTGDIALDAADDAGSVLGVDLTPRMIHHARARADERRRDGRLPVPQFVVGDMLAIPVVDGWADVVTCGYGLRNVVDLREALLEIARVMRPGARLVTLDFNRPRLAPVRTLFLAYLTVVGSVLGWLLHRDPDTYRYIAESLKRYPDAHGVANLLHEHGFTNVRIVRVMGGLLSIHVAVKP